MILNSYLGSYMVSAGHQSERVPGEIASDVIETIRQAPDRASASQALESGFGQLSDKQREHMLDVPLDPITGRASSYYGLLVSVWALMQFISSPILGALSVRFGRRRVIL